LNHKSKNLLAIIPARGGSKRLPRKNILDAAGRPLIAWTISAAYTSKAVNSVVLSTEDDEIIEAARAWGCETVYRRPDNLAHDKSSSLDVVLHVLERFPGFEYVALLQPTSPLRNGLDIDNAFSLLKSAKATTCVSICEAKESPYWMYFLNKHNSIAKILPDLPGDQRRQALPNVYTLNGAIYLAKIDWLLKAKTFIDESTIGYVMPQERSIDIDTAEDFQVAIQLLNKNNL